MTTRRSFSPLALAAAAVLWAAPGAAQSDPADAGPSSVASAPADAGPAATTAVPADAALPPLPTFDRMDYAKMHAGKILSEATDNEGHGGKVHAYEICRCTVDALWGVLTNHAPFPEFVPRVTKMEVSRRTERGERARQTIDASISTVRYTLDYSWDKATRHIDFHLAEDEPHDLKAVQGVWQLWPIDHGQATLLEYISAVDTGRQIPGFIRDYLADRGVKDTLGAVRGRAEGAH